MNLDRYRSDIERLLKKGRNLSSAMVLKSLLEREDASAAQKKTAEDALNKLPNFDESYQAWYSEALRCISQLLPDREADFIAYYKPDRTRKEITNGNYTISDYLRGITVTRGPLVDVVAKPDAAIPVFEQQLSIIEAVNQRFESSLFDIRALVQADFFDNELDSAAELNMKGFQRAAGAVAGVVLEEHLATVCEQHMIPMPMNATISKLNDLLKEKEVLDLPTWRFIQRLGDLRNLCDHKRPQEPTVENIDELVAGARKVTKTVY